MKRGALVLALLLAGLACQAAEAPTVTADDSRLRTQELRLFIDPVSGCHYLVNRNNNGAGGVVERKTASGAHMGCKP